MPPQTLALNQDIHFKLLAMSDFHTVKIFEQKVAEFFGAPYAVAVDCCTHAIELSLVYTKADKAQVPQHTYISVPFTLMRMGIPFEFIKYEWTDYYYVTDKVIDAAVLWKKNSYIPGRFMCLSFQAKKHLSLGRGGMILTDNALAADTLKRLSYDGRKPFIPWAEQDIVDVGYHYYMTPETAELGLSKLDAAISTPAKTWSWNDYPYLPKMRVFENAFKFK